MTPQRINLLYLIPGFGMGGTERQVVALARVLDRARFDLRVACLRRWGHLLDDIEALGVPVTEYGIDRLYGPRTLRQQLHFARALRRHRPHIVHVYNFYPIVFGVPITRILRVPTIVSIRDTGVYLTPWQRRVQRAVCRLADRIVANAEAVRQWLLAEGYDARKIHVIGNGLDVSPFTATNGNGHVRRELGLRTDAPVVAVVSRLSRQKGLEDFLEAAALVAPRLPAVQFLIVGDSHLVRDGRVVPDVAYRQALVAHATRLGLGDRVVFAGFRRDVAQVLSEVTVSVLPSLSEGLSNVLLESMAAGVPVIATRVGGNPEIVEDGRTGMLVPPSDPAALAGAMCAVLENPERSGALCLAGRRRIAERFSIERMVRTTERFYLDVLETAR